MADGLFQNTATPEEIRAFYELLKENSPTMRKKDIKKYVETAVRFAKDVLKGKAAELYGISLDWAISIMQNPNAKLETKRDIALKVLGHCMPQEVTLNAAEELRPVIFGMERPAQAHVEEDEKNTAELPNWMQGEDVQQ